MTKLQVVVHRNLRKYTAEKLYESGETRYIFLIFLTSVLLNLVKNLINLPIVLNTNCDMYLMINSTKCCILIHLLSLHITCLALSY